MRIGYVLSANTIGELTQELLYLRMERLRLPLILGLGALVLEIAEFVFQALVLQGLAEPAPFLEVYLNAVQSAIFLVSGILVLTVIRLYTPLGIERRIEENMETIALLAGTRRRRRDRGERAERGERRPRDAEDEERDTRDEGKRRRGGRRDRIEAG